MTRSRRLTRLGFQAGDDSQSEALGEVDPAVVALDEDRAAERRELLAPLRELAVEVGRSFAGALRMETEARAKGFQQRQVGEALDRVEAPAWVLAVGAEGRAGIAVAFDTCESDANFVFSLNSFSYSSTIKSPFSAIGAMRSFAPVFSQRICHGTMFE